VVSRELFHRPSGFGDTYNVTQNSLLVTVALAIARVFDLSDTNRYPAGEQDKASIPVLAHLLMREEVQGLLLTRARTWMSELTAGAELGENDCRHAIDTALRTYQTFLSSTDAQDALSRIRQFRTRRLADPCSIKSRSRFLGSMMCFCSPTLHESLSALQCSPSKERRFVWTDKRTLSGLDS
jgi:hypothetical protein